MTSLRPFEFAVLASVLTLGTDAHAMTIRAHLEQYLGRAPARGALYTTLARLEDKGLVRSRLGEPLPVRGGKARRYYAVTAAGQKSLARSRAELIDSSRGLVRLLEQLP